jgi:hypothetical protein
MGLNVSSWSIRHPLPSIVFSIILLALGWISFTKLAVTRLPSADIPVISVGQQPRRRDGGADRLDRNDVSRASVERGRPPRGSWRRAVRRTGGCDA